MKVPMPTDLEARVLRAARDTGFPANARAPGHKTGPYSQAKWRVIGKGWMVEEKHDVVGRCSLTPEGIVALGNYDRRKEATEL